MNQLHSGLYSNDHQEVALLDVAINADIRGHHSCVTIKQKYQNQESTPIEVTYLFPVQDRSAIFQFKVHSGDKVILGEVKEREEAFEAYDDAILEGHGAYLMDQERQNVLQASVGNLAPGQEVDIEISYHIALDVIEGQCRLLIPTVVAPRYVPNSMEERLGMSENERWNSPRSDDTGYELSLRISLADVGGLIAVESPSHPIKTQLQGDQTIIELAQRITALDKDFILKFAVESVNQAQIIKDEHGHFLSVLYGIPQQAVSERPQREVICLLDISGSMDGTPLQEAKNALSLLLRGLNEGDTFNIIYFESQYHKLWKESRPYTQDHLELALTSLKKTESRGGTEIYKPLKDIFKRSSHEGTQQRIILLTDGAVANEQEVISLCRKYRKQATIIAFGVGYGVSESLVKGVAEATAGFAEFIHPNERIEPKVLRATRKLYENRHSIQIDWGAEVRATSDQITGYGGDSSIIYAQIMAGQAIPETLTLRQGEQTIELPILHLSPTEKSAISALWARERIHSLESQINSAWGSLQDRSNRKSKKKSKDQQIKDEVIQLGVDYQLMSQFTSFVAVEVREEGDRPVGGMQLRSTPLNHIPSTQWKYNIQSRSNLWTGSFDKVFSQVFAGAVSQSSSSRSAKYDEWASPNDQVMYSMNFREMNDELVEYQKHTLPLSVLVDDSAPVSSPPPPKSYSELDKLLILLGEQQANGLFSWNTLLDDVLDEQWRSDNGEYSDIEFTLLVLKVLEEQFADLKEIWGSAAEKSMRHQSITGLMNA
jgi:Ca-activated chloride channel homolog